MNAESQRHYVKYFGNLNQRIRNVSPKFIMLVHVDTDVGFYHVYQEYMGLISLPSSNDNDSNG